jgi:hypothetical protein
LANIDGEAIKASYDRAFGGAPPDDDRAFTEAAARRALRDVKW